MPSSPRPKAASRQGPKYLADVQTFSSLPYRKNENARAIVIALAVPLRWTEAKKAVRNVVTEGTFKEWWGRLKAAGAIRPAPQDAELTEPAPAARVGFWGRLERHRLDRELAKVDYALAYAEEWRWPRLRKDAERRRRSLLEAYPKGR